PFQETTLDTRAGHSYYWARTKAEGRHMLTRAALRILAIGLALMTLQSGAQTIVSTVRGRVTDPQSGVVSDATVTARQNGTNLTRSTRTDSLGQYLIANLPAGSYELTVEQSGFAQARQAELVLRVGEEATVDFALKVAGVQQSVTVTEEAGV